MKNVITSLWWKTSLLRRFVLFAAAKVRDSETNHKPKCQSNDSRPFTIVYACIRSPFILSSSNNVMPQILSVSSYGKSFKLVGIFEARLWRFSKTLTSTWRKGFQTEDANSRIGLSRLNVKLNIFFNFLSHFAFLDKSIWFSIFVFTESQTVHMSAKMSALF